MRKNLSFSFMRSKSNFLIKFLKGELRTVVALSLLLLVLVGLGWAAGDSALYKFDFGDGQGIEPGYIAVNGNMSSYPQFSEEIEFGWLGGVIERSSGATVADLLRRDSNTGVEPASFKMAGMVDDSYIVEIITGDLSDSFSTKVSVGGRSYMISTEPNHWQSFTFGVMVTEGKLEFLFERSGTDLWGINALTLTPSATPPSIPIFEMNIQPSEHIVKKGGQVVYKVSLAPLYGYAVPVNLSLTGLTEGITAQFIPAEGQPPFTADLQITTSTSVATIHYDFVVNAKGTDPEVHSVNQNIVLIITDTLYFPIVTGDPTQEPKLSDSAQQQLDDLYSRPATLKKAKEAQKLIDEFVKKIQEKRLASQPEIKAIEDIETINVFPVLKEFPIPETTFESTLLYLTTAGMIDMVVDTAPPLGRAAAPPLLGFFGRLFRVFSNPVQ